MDADLRGNGLLGSKERRLLRALQQLLPHGPSRIDLRQSKRASANIVSPGLNSVMPAAPRRHGAAAGPTAATGTRSNSVWEARCAADLLALDDARGAAEAGHDARQAAALARLQLNLQPGQHPPLMLIKSTLDQRCSKKNQNKSGMASAQRIGDGCVTGDMAQSKEAAQALSRSSKGKQPRSSAEGP